MRAQTGIVLVVGHRNTVTAVLPVLGGPKLAALRATSFHHAFVLQPSAEPPRWTRFSYGAAGEAPAPGCL